MSVTVNDPVPLDPHVIRLCSTLPMIFRISSRPQLPASLFPPSTQFRKRARLFENSIGLNGFYAGPRPFRAWTLGQGADAGGYNEPGLPNIVGGFARVFGSGDMYGAFLNTGGLSGLAGSSSTTFRLEFNASKSNPLYGSSATVMPSSVNVPIILYLGRPK